MKTLLLMRHCQAEDSTARQPDKHRSLTLRGEDDARRMGATLQREGLVPQLVVHSSARRAAQTAGLVAGELGIEGVLLASPRLYAAETEGYLEEIQLLPDDVDMVLVVGHNPSVADLATRLYGQGLAVAHFPAGAMAGYEFPGDGWISIRPSQGNCRWYHSPENSG